MDSGTDMKKPENFTKNVDKKEFYCIIILYIIHYA